MSTLLRLLQMNWVLAGILIVGLALRLWGVGYGLPYAYLPDEPTYLTIALDMLRKGDLNPHWWFYPSLMFYLNALALFVYFLARRLFGQFTALADLQSPEILITGVAKLALPDELVVTRGLSALASAVGIILVYLIARRFGWNRTFSLFAAFLYSVSPTIVEQSQRVGPDVFAMFFSLATFFFVIQIVDEPRESRYIWAGACAGFAIGSKYNAGLVVVSLIVAHFLRFGIGGWKRREIYVGLVALCVAFLISTPFALFDRQNFWNGVQFQAFSYSIEGHSGQEGDALKWYLSYLFGTEGWLVIAAALGGAYALITRSKKHLVLLSFPLVYFIFISSLLVRNARTIMQIIPFLDLLAVMFFAECLPILGKSLRLSRNWNLVSALVIASSLVIPPFVSSVRLNSALFQRDSREFARAWIETNLPQGSRIAIEAYSPYVDRSKFLVEAYAGMISHAPGWYVQNGFEYLVFSYGAYGRFYEDPDRYVSFKNQYDEFFIRFQTVARFNEGGYEIRVLKTNAQVSPAERIAAYFGIYNSQLELVGVDRDFKLNSGQPLKLAYYWRSIDSRREPLTLTNSIYDSKGELVASARSSLFGMQSSDRWPPGVTRVESELNLPSQLLPGIYQLEINVDGEDWGRVPLLDRSGAQTSDKFKVGQFKIAPTTPTPEELKLANSLNANFGNDLVLIGCRLVGTVRAGDNLAVKLYWQSRSKLEKNYTVFVHLLDAKGNLRAQVDTPPLRGAYPTSTWDPGEIVPDEIILPLPSDLVADIYTIELGVYEYPSLTLLSVFDRNGKNLGDHLILSDHVAIAK